MVGLNLNVHPILQVGEFFNFGEVFSPAGSLFEQYLKFVVLLVKICVVSLKLLPHRIEFLVQYLSVMHLFFFSPDDLGLAFAADIFNLFVAVVLEHLFLSFELLLSDFYFFLNLLVN